MVQDVPKNLLESKALLTFHNKLVLYGARFLVYYPILKLWNHP